jgi:hypothetical protein
MEQKVSRLEEVLLFFMFVTKQVFQVKTPMLVGCGEKPLLLK